MGQQGPVQTFPEDSAGGLQRRHLHDQGQEPGEPSDLWLRNMTCTCKVAGSIPGVATIRSAQLLGP